MGKIGDKKSNRSTRIGAVRDNLHHLSIDNEGHRWPLCADGYVVDVSLLLYGC